jgi:SH3-like domain-containing protein
MRGLLVALIALAAAAPAAAQEKKPPYWASIASGEAMMRTGPAKTYPGIWLYKRRDLPVRVLKVFPNWRLIEDPDGAKGWMLVTLLSDRRTAMIRPGGVRSLHAKPDSTSRVTSKVEPGVVGRLDHCDSGWCEMTVGSRVGFVRFDDIWGINSGETID